MTRQLTFDFEPGLSQRNKSLKGHVREQIYRSPKPLKTIAGDMDQSATELSRKLGENPDDVRNFTCDDLERYIESTGDISPIHYLIEKYAVNDEAKARYAQAELAKVLPQLLALVTQSGLQSGPPAGRKK
jgi:hypothetical protein